MTHHASLNRRALLAAVGLAVPGLALAQTAAPSPPQAGPFRFKGWKGLETDAERGFFEVPEDRRDPRSRKIRLSYVRFASTAAKPGPPIVYLAGGPGGVATRALAGPRFSIMMALREVADVIAFEQRGTGLSNHIPERPLSSRPLPEFTEAGLTAYFREDFKSAWADWTKAGVAMTGYNTEQNADDIEDLRRHLGGGEGLSLGHQLRHAPSADHAQAAWRPGQPRGPGQP